jgi:hypothetical protein
MPVTISDFPKGQGGNPQVHKKFFAACGTASGVRRLKPILKNKDGGDVGVAMYRVHLLTTTDQGGGESINWVIVFEQVDKGIGHKLTVQNVDDPSDQSPPKTFDAVDFRPKFEVPQIESPDNDSTVPHDNFAPYGTIDQSLPMYAIMRVGSTSWSGSLVEGPPTTLNWVFLFSGLNTGSGATLTVYSYDGSTQTTYSAHRDHLAVQ